MAFQQPEIFSSFLHQLTKNLIQLSGSPCDSFLFNTTNYEAFVQTQIVGYKSLNSFYQQRLGFSFLSFFYSHSLTVCSWKHSWISYRSSSAGDEYEGQSLALQSWISNLSITFFQTFRKFRNEPFFRSLKNIRELIGSSN